MGLLGKLFGTGAREPAKAAPVSVPRWWKEWDGEPVTFDLPKSAVWLSVRQAAVPAGRRSKWQWVRLSTREQKTGKHVGERVIVVTWDDKLVGEVFPKDRAKFARLFELVESGVTAASCRFGWDNDDDAQITLGSHKYEPRRPWIMEDSL